MKQQKTSLGTIFGPLMTISQCIEIEQKFKKIVSKSWFIYPIWTIGTYKLLLVGLEFTVKRSTYIKKLAVMFNFCSYPLP